MQKPVVGMKKKVDNRSVGVGAFSLASSHLDHERHLEEKPHLYVTC